MPPLPSSVLSSTHLDIETISVPVLVFDAQGAAVGGNGEGWELLGSSAAAAALSRLALAPHVAAQTVSIGGKRFLALRCTGLGNRHIILIPIADDAHTDALTGLLSRTGLQAAASDASPARYAVHYIDLDRFKFVNDSLGHPAGDALLRLVGARLRKLCGDEGLVARFGGDEFVVMQVDLDKMSPESMARRLVDLLSRTYIIEGRSVNVGASVGVAMGHTGSEFSEIVSNADLALYAAKRGGRGCHRFFDSAMKDAVEARRDLESALRAALALEEFSVVYQPQVDLATRTVTGFEALLRWTRSDGTAVSPANFIPLAEEMGLMPAIGEWVLRTATRDAASWNETLSVSVNVSPLQFKDAKLAETVLSAVASSGLASSRLDLEITEGTLLDNTEDVLATLHLVKAFGVTVSMDDFGTGYSSLSYLQKFPFDKLKIDQSFIRGDDNEGTAALIKAVASVAASLKMATVAEGVETPDQLSMVAAQGVNAVQGYFTGRPMPSADIAAFLEDRS